MRYLVDLRREQHTGRQLYLTYVEPIYELMLQLTPNHAYPLISLNCSRIRTPVTLQGYHALTNPVVPYLLVFSLIAFYYHAHPCYNKMSVTPH